MRDFRFREPQTLSIFLGGSRRRCKRFIDNGIETQNEWLLRPCRLCFHSVWSGSRKKKLAFLWRNTLYEQSRPLRGGVD